MLSAWRVRETSCLLDDIFDGVPGVEVGYVISMNQDGGFWVTRLVGRDETTTATYGELLARRTPDSRDPPLSDYHVELSCLFSMPSPPPSKFLCHSISLLMISSSEDIIHWDIQVEVSRSILVARWPYCWRYSLIFSISY